jgi:predicted RNase H-like nuclease (RuvC/YqgF family)
MSSDKIVGIDIIRSGSDLSQFRYAMVFLEGEALKAVKEVSFGGLIRELWEIKPDVLATDNVLELGGSKRDLLRVIKMLPPSITLVQVNVESGKPVKIQYLAEKAGLVGDKSKLDPFKTALVIAYLAREGYGSRLRVFEDKVKIYVYPGRSGIAGGSRTEKYVRNLRAIVTRHVRKIKEVLDKNNIDYDLTVRKSDGGVEKALFTVYTPRERLYGLIKQVKGKDVVVKIKPVLNKSFLSDLVELRRGDEERYLIVGYDPGVNVGLAVLDLDMNLVYVTSGRELDRGDIHNLLVKLGRPVLVATDKNPPPEMCRKLAASLGALLYVPQKSLSTAEKEVAVSEFVKRHPSIDVKNTHERDALAAALKAYGEFQEKLDKLSYKLREMGFYDVNLQRYKVKVLMNEDLSTIIEEVINDYVREERKESAVVLKSDVTAQAPRVEEALKERVSVLEREKEFYKQRVLELENAVRELSSRLDAVTSELNERVLKDRKVSELMQRVRNLEARLRILENENSVLKSKTINYENLFMKLYADTHVLVPVYNDKCLKFLRNERGGVLVAFTYNVTEALKEARELVESARLGFLLPPTTLGLSKHLIEEESIPAVSVEEVFEVNECLVVADRNSFDRVIALVPQLSEERRKKRYGLTYEDINALIEEYRKGREF